MSSPAGQAPRMTMSPLLLGVAAIPLACPKGCQTTAGVSNDEAV
jgi:hypothetical protein